MTKISERHRVENKYSFFNSPLEFELVLNKMRTLVLILLERMTE